MVELLTEIRSWVWGPLLIIALVGTGIYLTYILQGIQFRKLGMSLFMAFFQKKDQSADGDISHFQALMTALAATIGTGNIVGVATALSLGGPGAIFWLWMTGLFGMATKYSEAVLAVKFRQKDLLGNMCGGPMYYLSNGLHYRWLALFFAVATSIAAFGIGNLVQSNSVADALEYSFSIPFEITGLVLAIAVAIVLIGGIKEIGVVTSFLVPFMMISYFLATALLLVLYYEKIPGVILMIVQDAFSGSAAVGGFAGATMMMAIRNGISRGIFSNESGLGSAPIAAAAAKTKHPVSQALVSMTQTFVDTIIICSMTAIAILVTDVLPTGKSGAELTQTAFSEAFGSHWGSHVVAFSLILFAFSTILAWSYYGEKSIEYIFGEKSIIPYRVLFVIVVYIGAVAKLGVVWMVADIMNGFMVIPNLVGLIGLRKVIVDETNDFFREKK